ncbi:MAG TPA: hypothetical protein VF834_12580 [Streptosporangiaceae bacterium]
MSELSRASAVKWWAMVIVGTAAALLIAWLGRITGVPLRTLVSIGIGAVALAWLVVLVAVPWNLYFAARQAGLELAVSRGRGIAVRPEQEAEARQIGRRMLWFALGGHVLTAAAAALVGHLASVPLGYYAAAAYLLSAVIRPAVAYFAHLRERIGLLRRESTHPRDDVVTIQSAIESLTAMVTQLRTELRGMTDDVRRTEYKLNDSIAHARQTLTADLTRLQDAQAADREEARSREAHLGRRVDAIARQVDAALDGISDHQEVQAGLRALVRMIRSDAAGQT